MKSKTFVYSVVIHLAVAASLLFAAERKQARKATAISMAEEKKKEKPKEEKPKPVVEKPPPPKPAKKASAEPPKPVNAPPPPVAPSKPAGPAPVDTGLTMDSGDGPGIPVGPAKGTAPTGPDKGEKHAETGPKRPAPAPRKKDEPKPDDECQEDPTKPEPISKVEIEYTQAARAAGIEGRLVLRVTVDKDGGVSKVDVVSGVDPQLDAAAIAAVERWRFKPSMRCGKPMAGGIYTLARRFELGD